MDLGLHYRNFSAPGNPQRIADTLAAAAETAEEAGFAECGRLDQADAAGSARVTRRITDNRMMVTAKQIPARRNVTCPAHHLELGMA
jgi:hypothetical protein